MDVDFHFEKSRGDLRPILSKALSECKSLKVVTGFVTKSGITQLLTSKPEKLDLLIFGHSNISALDAMKDLFYNLSNLGKEDIIKIHLGYGHRLKEVNGLRPLYRPMMHSKIFFFENYDSTFRAFVGSQNVTGFSLSGLNSEATVIIEGSIVDKIYEKILRGIRSVDLESQVFRPERCEFYLEWFKILYKGSKPAFPKVKRESVAILYALVDLEGQRLPKVGDSIYLELSEKDGVHFQKINGKTDIWLFPTDSNGRSVAISEQKPLFFRASIVTINNANSSEIINSHSDWYMNNFSEKTIKYINGVPEYNKGHYQVRLKLDSTLEETYHVNDYKIVRYEPVNKNFKKLTPILDKESTINGIDQPAIVGHGEESLNHKVWSLIKGFNEWETHAKELEIYSDEILQPLVAVKKFISLEGVYFKQNVRRVDPDTNNIDS